jgi:hypothetical protein
LERKTELGTSVSNDCKREVKSAPQSEILPATPPPQARPLKRAEAPTNRTSFPAHRDCR